MPIALNHIGQIAVTVDDPDVAERFYGETLGLRKLFRFGNLSFFDRDGVRLMVDKLETAGGSNLQAPSFTFEHPISRSRCESSNRRALTL